MTKIIYRPKSSLGEELLSVRNYLNLKPSNTFSNKLGFLLTVYGLVFLIWIVSNIVAVGIDAIVVHSLHYKSIRAQYINNMRAIFQHYNYWIVAVYVSILGPVIEECIFRLPLSFKRNHIALSCGLIILFLVRFFPGIDSQGWMSGISIRIVLIVFTFLLTKAFMPENIKLSNKAKRTFILISSLSFGLLHIMNFRPFQLPILYLYPLFVLPQMALGFVMTYLRLKNGLGWSIALHCLNNTVAVIMMNFMLKLH